MKYKTDIFTNVLEDITGGNPKVLNSDYKIEGKYPIIDQGEKFINGYTDDYRKVNRKSDVIVFGDHTKKFKYVNFDFCLGADGVKVLQPINGDNAKFLYYYLITLKLPDVGYSRHYKFLKDIEIPLPPLSVQHRIAEILDLADLHRQKTKELLLKYDLLAQSLFIDMFGDPVANHKNWEVKRLGEMISEGPTNGLYKPSKDYGSGIPIIRIDSFFNSVIDLSKLKRVNITEQELLRFNIEEGDFVINRVNSKSHLGKCGLVPKLQEKIVYESNMMRIKFNNLVLNNYYLLYILSTTYFKNQILSSAKDAVNQSSINQNDVKEFQIPVPPLSLQNQFAERIQEIEKQKELASRAAQKAEELFGSLLQKAFSGELVPE